jgi:PAS domain S-box-containing protein
VESQADFLAGLRMLPDIVLSDYLLPQFDGLKAARLLRESGLDIPFILISGTVGEEVAVEAMKHGAADYLLKDRIARLGAAVRRALEEKKLRQEQQEAKDELRRTLETLRQSEEKFRQLAENINEVFWITDPTKSQMLYVSPAYEEIWGRTCESLYQSPQSWVAAIHPEDRERIFDSARLKQPQGEYEETYRIVRPDGTVRWIHDQAFPVRDAAGKIYRIVGTAEDVTQRKAAEQQFRQAQKMEGIGLLAGGIAHDFNNLIMIIQVNLELVLMREENLHPETKQHLDDIAEAASRAAALNRQLLTFSRSEAMQMRQLDLNDLTSGFSKMLRRIVGEHIRVRNELEARAPLVKGDPGMIEQVLMNLAVNARDAMPKGGQIVIGTKVVEFHESEARLDPRVRPGQFACLSVRDTGTGIHPEIMSRIFEPFFTTKGVGKGTGLGLATVFGIAQQHHGWVDVTSAVGAGTNFRVFFPLSSEDVAAPAAGAAETIRGGTEKILLVEDEKGVRTVLLRILENHGYTVMEADSGVVAQLIWSEQGGQFDLLITDMVMPGGSTGLELIELLRVQKPGLKVLLMSGYSAELARGEIARAKGITFLHKPFSSQVLAETVRKCLDAE